MYSACSVLCDIHVYVLKYVHYVYIEMYAIFSTQFMYRRLGDIHKACQLINACELSQDDYQYD